MARHTGRVISSDSVAKARDPLPALLRQIVARAGEPCAALRTASRPWCSALFQGRRHIFRLRLEGDDAAVRLGRLIAGIGDVEWTLNGHFVADIAIDDVLSSAQGEEVELSALTIEEW